MWLATFDGLARFDGLHFTVFNKSNSPGLNNNRLTALYEESRDDLRIGSENGAVTRYHDGKFISYTSQDGLRDGQQVLGISGDAKGNVWVLSGNNIMRWTGGRFLSASNSFPSDLPFASCVIQRDGRGGFWGVNSAALFHFEGGRLERWTKREGLPSLNVQSVAKTSVARFGSSHGMRAW